MNQKLKNVLLVLLIYICSIFGGLLLSVIAGSIYSSIFNLSCADNIFIAFNFDKGCKMEGFIYSYSFLLPFFSFLLLKLKKAWINYAGGIILFVILSIFIGYYKGLIIFLMMLLVGWLLAQGGLLIYGKSKR